MRFDTEITLTGPWRRPAQMLAEQEYDGHASVHDDDTAPVRHRGARLQLDALGDLDPQQWAKQLLKHRTPG